jgi:L-ascorbate metabolism protein UlaG (beta-lactamase superfamily)
MTFARRDLLVAGAGLAIAAPRLSAAPIPTGAPGGMRVQRLSWAGIKLVVGQTTIFVDALLPPDKSAVPLTADTEARFALVTHHHGDHCDPEALKPVLKETGVIVAQKEVARFVNPMGVRLQVAEMHEPVFLSRGNGDFVARAAPAVDGLGSPQVSWVVDGGGRRILHCGDTLWHGYWWDIGRAYGPFDMVFVPINGFRQVTPRFGPTGVPMSLTPEQAAAAALALGAKVACPIHYGRSATDYTEVPKALDRFEAAARAAGLPLRVPAGGEWLTL